MVVGIPGTGIAGLFYILSVLFMPLRELVKLVRGKSNLGRWKFIIVQLGLASGIIFSYWLTAWVLAIVIPHAFLNHTSSGNVVKVKLFVISIALLFAVLISVEILRFFIPKPQKAHLGGLPGIAG